MAKLTTVLRSSVAAICIAATAAPVSGFGQPSEQPIPNSQPLEIRAGQAPDFSRLEFHWVGGAQAASKRDGQVLTLRFNRNASPNLANLKVFPPRWLKSIQSRSVGGRLEVELTLDEGADAKVGQADGVTYVNLFEAKTPPAPAPASAGPAQAAAPAQVVLGPIQVTTETLGNQLSMKFPWPETVAAAVFRRGDTVWVVFDAPAKMDISGLPRVAPQFTNATVTTGPTYTVVQIHSPSNVQVAAKGEGGLWTVVLGQGPVVKPTRVTVQRDSEADVPALTAAVAGATRVIWLDDPIVGDRFAAITALGPAKGLEDSHRYVELRMLPSAQGLVVVPARPDLTVAVEGDLVRIGRPQGLALSPLSTVTASLAVADGPRAATMPALIDFVRWSNTGEDSFNARYDALVRAAGEEAEIDEANGGKAPQVQARMALARFLVGSQLAHEAIGVLDLLAETDPQVLSDAEFRGLRGASKAIAGRYEEASVDLASPTLARDPSSALWRGYIAAKSSRWTEARKAFAEGYAALPQFAPDWRAQFARTDAEAAFNLQQYDVAETELKIAASAGANNDENLATSLWQARLFDARGDKRRALEIYDLVGKAPREDLAVAAQLYATKLRLKDGTITPIQAANTFDGLRYRWRGDATELETIKSLGELYLNLGKYRQALEALTSTPPNMAATPEAVALSGQAQEVFRELFLDGKADGLEPIQAVGLFEDFKQLTPLGADGLRMVRKLSQRLIDVDLLDQAADLLKYQVDERLDGVAQAQVATDLALIYLMDRRPEDALNAINASRTTIVPNDLRSERRLVSGRALMALGRYDAALEMIDLEHTGDADDLRAEIDWKQRAWAKVGPDFENRLGDRWKTKDKPLTAAEEAKLLRASIGYSLASDQASLARLRERYSGFVDGAHIPDALRIGLAGVEKARLTPTDFNRLIEEGDTFGAWVNDTKKRFRDQNAPTRQAQADNPASG